MSASITFLLTHSLAWALLYSLWQGLIVYGVLFILLKVLRNVRADVRYHLSLGAFGALFVWFLNTWMEQYERIKGITIYITQGGSTVAQTVASHRNTGALTMPDNTNSILRQAFAGLEHYSIPIVVAYSVGLVLMLARFVLSLWQVRQLKRDTVAAPHVHLAELMEYWQDQFGITKKVKLLLSSRIDVPVMLGVIKPIILLPVASVNNMSIDQLEAILMHELAHIRRNDYLLNMIQTIAETILFFNPFVWLMSAEIRREREHCCDDMVVTHATDPLPYAKALAMLETSRYEGSLSLAATGNKHQLLNRIKRIMEMKKQNINYGQAGIIVLAVAAIICSVAIFTPSFAQKSKQKKEKQEKEKVESVDSTTTTTTTNGRSITRIKVITIDSNGKKNVVNKTIQSGNGMDATISYSDDDFSVDMSGAMKAIAEAAKEIADATNKVDKAEMERDMEDARKEIAKARKEMDAVDWDEIRSAINKGLAEADRALNDPKLKEEIEYEVRQGLAEGKRALAEAKREMHKSMSISVSSDDDNVVVAGSGDFNEMLDMMEDDGLINRRKGFAIAKNHDKLVINGDVQPDSVYNKYRRYLKARKIAISGARGNLSISVKD